MKPIWNVRHEIFLKVPKISGSNAAMTNARNILALAHEKPVSPELKQRCYALADSLFRSFGAQLTVEKHHAMSGRETYRQH